MAFRQAVFWLHLVAGVVAGIVILAMSVTGVLLAIGLASIGTAGWFHRVGNLPRGCDGTNLNGEVSMTQGALFGWCARVPTNSPRSGPLVSPPVARS